MKKETQFFVGILAFCSLLLFTLSFILNSLLSISTGLLTTIGYGFSLAVILITAKIYVNKLSIFWEVIYYIIAVCAVLDYFFGIF